jgi:hypothetical protein
MQLFALRQEDMSWIQIYKDEDAIIQTSIDNADAKIIPPLGYNTDAFIDLDEGNFNTSIDEQEKTGQQQNFALQEFKKKKLWELATSPAKSILMNFGMTYMTPNEIQVIPIMMLFMLFIQTFKEIYAMNEKFRTLDASINFKIDTYDINIMKFVYILSCFGNLLVGFWKLNSIGLMPNNTSDWLSWESKLQSKERFIYT